jgi:PTS system nitrogen regulatory IIA component
MEMSDLLSAADVSLDLDAANKQRLLEILAAQAAARLGRSEQEVLSSLEARERLGSTALGKGLALPHAQLRGADRPLMLVARLRRPIDFQAPDEAPVDLVIMVLWPEDSADGFLPVLSEICRAVGEPQALNQLRRANSPEEIVALIDRQSSPDAAAARAPAPE